MSNQHTVIIGGSSGIGLATARRLLAEPAANVTITGRDPARLAKANDALGGRATVVVMDASATDALPAAFEKIGKLDHLVLALGSARGVGPFATMPVADMKLGFEEKVFAHFATAQAALPFLRADGSITFVAAIQGGMPGTSGIAAANAAILGLARVLANELKPIRVNAVSPGVIDTPWWDAMPAAQKTAMFADLAKQTPVGRVGHADDVAQAIAFLVGNAFMTGDNIVVDGGITNAK